MIEIYILDIAYIMYLGFYHVLAYGRLCRVPYCYMSFVSICLCIYPSHAGTLFKPLNPSLSNQYSVITYGCEHVCLDMFVHFVKKSENACTCNIVFGWMKLCTVPKIW